MNVIFKNGPELSEVSSESFNTDMASFLKTQSLESRKAIDAILCP
jgi:hypothetical protein